MVEIEAVCAALFPMIVMIVLEILRSSELDVGVVPDWTLYVFCVLCAYFMLDTLTYLLSLIFLADILSPSANQLRSFLLLVFNYLQMIFGIALFYYCYLWGKIDVWTAFDYSIYGDISSIYQKNIFLRMIQYAKLSINFLFIILAFSYAVGQLKQMRFLSE